ncbi:MAG: hypothetical protein ACRC2H_04150 [Silanimonas sp.]
MSDPSKPSPPTNDNAAATVVSAEVAAASALAAASLATRPRRDMRYINVLASLLAVFVSLVSLWLAWSSNRTQERMLAASSWPYLRFGHGNLADDGAPVIQVSVSNGGSGPAVLHWVRFKGGGALLGDVDAVFEWASPGARDLTSWSSGTTGVALSPGDQIYALQFHRTDANLATWDALNAARWRIEADGCYCSIIGDCWTFTGDGQPQPVAACPAPPEGAWRG